MLLESVLAELSIDDDYLSDHRQQMLRVKTHAAATQESYSHITYSKTPQNYTLRTHKVVLEMYSPQESSRELLKNSGKLMKHMTHLAEEYYSYKAPPDCVPFRWPGVRKSVQTEEELRDAQSMHPIARSASAAILPFSHSVRTSSASLQENGSGFSWNLSHLNRQSIDVFEGSVQGENMSDYDGDDYDYEYEDEDMISPNIELDSHRADWIDKNLAADEAHSTHNSNVEFTTMPSSPARTAGASLQWGAFPRCLCKCFVPPSVKQEEKSKQAVRATMRQGKESKGSFTSHGLKMRLACQPVRARAKKNSTKQLSQ